MIKEELPQRSQRRNFFKLFFLCDLISGFLFLGIIAASCVFSGSLMHNVSRAYQKLFAAFHYEYVGLHDFDIWKEVSWQEKIFCKNEFATNEMLAFLKNIEEGYGDHLAANRKREVASRVIDSKRIVVKSMEFPGFISNICRMGLGVNVWNNADYATKLGIPVLKTIGFVEKRHWNSSKTYSVYLFEGKACDQEINHSCDWFPKIQELKNKLFKQALIHDDFRIKNMVLLESGAIQLIDIDKIHYYPRNSVIFRARMDREVRKFNQNLLENLVTQIHIE